MPGWLGIVSCAVGSSIVLLVVGITFHFGVPAVAPGIPPQFANSALFRPWSGWASTYMLVHPLWFGVVFAMGYLALQSKGALPPGWSGGLAYGVGLFVIGSMPIFLLIFAAMQVSPPVITVWAVQNLAQYAAAGLAVAAIARWSR